MSAGLLVAAGIFAFITMIGVVQRMAARSKTVKYITIYEDIVVLGGTLGNLVWLYQWHIPTGYFILALYGLFSGIYVGCLAFAIAEVLNVLPIFKKRVKLTVGMPYIILTFAIAKALGTFYQFIIAR
ncbi:MAG: stage V sporulation protein AB [Clostridiales bacterium]|nr:stage V sporulation protein AB [Clostridiales bacterium]